MMADQYQGSGPGKTSPRIEQDLLDYDIRHPRRDGINLLFNPAPIFRAEKETQYYRKGTTDCRHDLWLKPSQSKTRYPGQAATTTTKDVLSVFCRLCSRHIDVIVDYTKRLNRTKPCAGDKEYPLHHWQPVRSEQPTESEKHSSTWKYDKYTEKHIWACSAPDCPAVLFIKISPPRLVKSQLVLLEDPKRLYARGQKIISDATSTDSRRFKDAKPSEPCEAINILRTYLTNALDETEHRRIMSRNIRFLLAFGDDCRELLEYIGFQYQTEKVGDDGHEEAFWKLPSVSPTCEPAVEGVPKSPRHFVEDVLWEVRRSLLNRPSEELARGKSEVAGTPDSGLQPLRIVLGSLKYDKDSRPIDLDAMEHPHYAGLGAVGEFADKLILWSYRRQTSCDPSILNKAYYLDCLKQIGTGRNSAFLQEEYAMIASMGEPTLTDIDNAYKFFALNPDVDHGDGHIIGVFKSWIEASPVQKDEAKRVLAIIGHARNSNKIKEVANDKTMTVEEALEFLGVATDTPSDSIMAAAVVKAADVGRSAVGRVLSIIGNARAEIALQMEGSSMETEDSEVGLSLDEAYSRLQVQDPNASEESIFTYYKTLIEGAPAGSKASYANALRVIAAARASSFLFAKLANPDAVVVPQRSTADQPVGLDNIGNTCYLNSLLQYFYTVRNFRDVVMNIETYRMPLDEQSVKQKRVGGRAVSKGEIIKAQQFVDELHNLYKNLKCASTQSVRPTQDLAELTLLTTEAEANFRRPSVSSPVGVRAVLVPFPPPPPPPPHSPPPVPIGEKDARTEEKEDIEMLDAPSEAAMTDEQRGVLPLTRKESKGQGVTIAEPQAPQSNTGQEAPNTGMSGETQIEHLLGTADGDHVMTNGAPLTPHSDGSSIAEKRPPIPPRNKPAPLNTSARTEEDLRKERLSFGAQQDVTEVIGNVLFRMSCAIKPVHIDAANFGEQIDSIRNTFYGSNTLHINKGGTYQKIPEVWNNIIVYPASQGSSSIYDALDVVYDEQMVSLEGSETNAFTTLSKLPPVLHIQIQRTSFDKVLKQASKNKNQVVFDETIYMDRYLEDEKALVRRKEELKWKSRIRQLEARITALEAPDNSDDSVSVAEALKGCKDFLEMMEADNMEGIEVQLALAAALENRASEVTAELEQLGNEVCELRKKIREQYTDMRQHRYRLHAVFMHRGTNAYGHYWIYIYDFVNDIWREYNDERVSVVDDRKRVFEQSGDTTPYYLAYVREEDKENLVDAVVREISDEATAARTGAAHYNGDAMDEDVVEINGAQHIESYEPRLDPRRSNQEGEGGAEDAWKNMQAKAVSQDAVMRS